jgi:hypothetical protein
VTRKTGLTKAEFLGDLFLAGLAYFIGCACAWWILKVIWGLVMGG